MNTSVKRPFLETPFEMAVWENTFIIYAIESVGEFLPFMGLPKKGIRETREVCREILVKYDRRDLFRDFEELNEFITTKLIELEEKIGQETLEKIFAWSTSYRHWYGPEGRIYVDMLSTWAWMIQDLYKKEALREDLVSMGVTKKKVDEILQYAPRFIFPDELERRIEEAEQKPVEGMDQMVFKLYDEDLDDTPFVIVHNQCRYQVWEDAQIDLITNLKFTREEMEILIEWANKNKVSRLHKDLEVIPFWNATASK